MDLYLHFSICLNGMYIDSFTTTTTETTVIVVMIAFPG
jgi:hypothetical protein